MAICGFQEKQTRQGVHFTGIHTRRVTRACGVAAHVKIKIRYVHNRADRYNSKAQPPRRWCASGVNVHSWWRKMPPRALAGGLRADDGVHQESLCGRFGRFIYRNTPINNIRILFRTSRLCGGRRAVEGTSAVPASSRCRGFLALLVAQ